MTEYWVVHPAKTFDDSKEYLELPEQNSSMKLLAIETSTLTGSIAVVENDKVLIELTLQVEETHSSQLLPAIEYVLKIGDSSADSLDGFAVAAGPGSFTGLRIGMSAAKGLAVAASKPLVAISTLEAMAWIFPFSGYPLCPMIDARMKEVYGAWFHAENGKIIRETEDLVLAPKKMIERVRGQTIFFGSGALRYKEEIVDKLGELALFPAQQIVGARAGIVGMLAAEKLQEGAASDLAAVEPIYIRQALALTTRKRQADK
jgi:tRNA threonylcarbamoyladenosine biosynthesis protein TsaB